MSLPIPAHDVEWALPLSDDTYLPFLAQAIEAAHHRVLASMFLVNPRLHADSQGNVRQVLHRLHEAQWKHVDVRILVGDSDKSDDIYLSNQTAVTYLGELGVPVRQVALDQESSHSKYVLIDDALVILGSHNWTPTALAENREDSIAIQSKDLAYTMIREFEYRWDHRSKKVDRNER